MFDPAVADALASCDEAMAIFQEGEEYDDSEHRRALASLGLCLEHYGDAINELAGEYTRLAD